MGALCGLASFTRQEVKEKLLEHSEFTEVIIFFFCVQCRPRIVVAQPESSHLYSARRFLKMHPQFMQ